MSARSVMLPPEAYQPPVKAVRMQTLARAREEPNQRITSSQSSLRAGAPAPAGVAGASCARSAGHAERTSCTPCRLHAATTLAARHRKGLEHAGGGAHRPGAPVAGHEHLRAAPARLPVERRGGRHQALVVEEALRTGFPCDSTHVHTHTSGMRTRTSGLMHCRDTARAHLLDAEHEVGCTREALAKR